jgi:hypothetical protein
MKRIPSNRRNYKAVDATYNVGVQRSLGAPSSNTMPKTDGTVHDNIGTVVRQFV